MEEVVSSVRSGLVSFMEIQIGKILYLKEQEYQ